MATNYFCTLYLRDIQRLSKRQNNVGGERMQQLALWNILLYLEFVQYLARVVFVSTLINRNSAEKLEAYFHYDRFLGAIYGMGFVDATLLRAMYLVALFGVLIYSQMYVQSNQALWHILEALLLASCDKLMENSRNQFNFRQFVRHPLRYLMIIGSIGKGLWKGDKTVQIAQVAQSVEFAQLTTQNRARLILLWIPLEGASHFLLLIGEYKSGGEM